MKNRFGRYFGYSVSIGAFSFLFMGSPLWAANDEVVLNEGATFKGDVTQDSMAGVVLNTQGGQVDYKPHQVKNIIFDVSNSEYQRGLREMQKGAYGSASESFQILVDPESLRTIRAIVRPYVLFLCGQSFYKAGKSDHATKVFQEFIKAYPDSRYVDQAVASLVDAAIQTKNYGIVPPLLEKLKQLGENARALALYYEGQMKLAQGDVAGAKEKYGQAASAADNEETRSLARLGQAECAIRSKDLDTAKKMAEQALLAGDNPAVAGTAYMIIGEVLFDEADKLKGDEARERYTDAVLHFMRIPICYGGDSRTEPRALFMAGECFQKFAKFSGKKSDRQRAASMYETVLQKYRGTSWAKKAEESMKKVQ